MINPIIPETPDKNETDMNVEQPTKRKTHDVSQTYEEQKMNDDDIIKQMFENSKTELNQNE